ncbi:hypothetical protein Barb6_03583 [Bacteroidales bacterium Barb6]|nr:hypothetical protein Barb6_03583 [Bacteroidales bacterium Barb6]
MYAGGCEIKGVNHCILITNGMKFKSEIMCFVAAQ